MKVAALYDIHGHLPALEAVIREIEEENVDYIVIGGDVVSGPLPNETLDYIRALDIEFSCIRGNAESDVIRYLAGEDINGMSERANEEARWVGTVLTPENVEFIQGWKETIELSIGEPGDVLFCHGTPRSDVEVFTVNTAYEKLLPIFSGLRCESVICGHTHIQFDRRIGGTRVINAGSIGMPFGHGGADWLLIDTSFEFRNSKFNVEAAASRIKASAYPHADLFIKNHIFSSPSEEEMLRVLTKMELSS